MPLPACRSVIIPVAMARRFLLCVVPCLLSRSLRSPPRTRPELTSRPVVIRWTAGHGFGLGLILWLAVFVTACAIQRTGVAQSPGATAELRDAVGQVVGAATFVETRDGITMVVTVRNLVAGVRGLHIHAVGKCVGPGFESAGDHFNPHGRQHGLANPAGPHAGDLPNLAVNESGVGRLTFTTSMITLMGRIDSVLGTDGTALVLDADSDDEMTEPSGYRAGRFACGVIVPTPAERRLGALADLRCWPPGGAVLPPWPRAPISPSSSVASACPAPGSIGMPAASPSARKSWPRRWLPS